MGFFSRLKTGWALSMDSLDVLRDEPSLTVFPAIAGIAGAIYLALVLGGAVFLVSRTPAPRCPLPCSSSTWAPRSSRRSSRPP